MKTKLIQLIIFLAIILIAFFVRTYNVNWDEGAHIHPDERFLTMVTNDMRSPKTFADYLNPQISTMNPYNINYGFFVYGTFPIYLVKILAIIFKMNNYTDITILGRYVSAVFDTGIVAILFFLTRTLFNCSIAPLLKKNSHEVRNNNRTIEQSSNRFSSFVPLLPPLLYSIMVLPIQLSHFFAVDTFLAFFMILSFYLSVLLYRSVTQKQWRQIFLLSTLLGGAIGLGLASKVTMAFIIPLDLLIIVLPLLHCFIASLLGKNSHEVRSSNGAMEQWNNGFTVLRGLICLVLIGSVAYFSFRLTMPIAFSTSNFFNFALNQKWTGNLKELQGMTSSSLTNTFPPSIQWFTTKPILFTLINLTVWGLGLPLGLLCIAGLIFNFQFLIFNENFKFQISNWKQKLKILLSPFILLSLFSLAFFIYQGSQFVKAMRYIYPIYWTFAIFGGLFIFEMFVKIKKLLMLPLVLIFSFLILLYPVSFMQIYSRPLTRVEASRWIFKNVPLGSRVTFEEWDDPLPLMVDGRSNNYPGINMPMFGPDSPQKCSELAQKISGADYIFLSSNRVYGAIPRRLDLFKKTVLYYDLLFAGKLGFVKIADFASRPKVPFTNIEFVDDNADESFTVYDHPRVLLFKNQDRLNDFQLTKLLCNQ